MAAIDALGGLLNAAKSKFSAGLGVIKAIACLPAIITGAMGLFQGGFGAALGAARGILGSIQGAIGGAIGAITGMVQGMVQNAINQVIGAISGVLDQIKALIGTIMAAINMIKDFFKNLLEEANAALAWSLNAENCRFAAADLLKCIMAKVLTEISGDLDISLNITAKLDSINNVTDKITSKITGAGGVIEGFLNKSEAQLNRATATINAASLI